MKKIGIFALTLMLLSGAASIARAQGPDSDQNPYTQTTAEILANPQAQPQGSTPGFREYPRPGELPSKGDLPPAVHLSVESQRDIIRQVVNRIYALFGRRFFLR